jgi:beta-xylosidase
MRAADPAAPGLILDPAVMRADPSVTWDPENKEYRLYTTQLWNANVPTWVSDRVEGPWEWGGDALPTPPEWASNDFRLWTPEVANVNGVWTLWASAGVKDSKASCLYRATGPSAAGPFVVDPGPPRWCDVSVGGAIDPQLVRDDDGVWWLVYKVNRNVLDQRTALASLRLGSDGLPTGADHTLLEADQPWEHDLIEAPGFIRDPVTHAWWLTFSGGKLEPDGTTNYQVSAVPCAAPAGPCSGQSRVPLLASNPQGAGPGEQSVFVDTDGGTWMSYNPVAPFVAPDKRPLALVRIGFDAAGAPYVAAPRQ